MRLVTPRKPIFQEVALWRKQKMRKEFRTRLEEGKAKVAAARKAKEMSS
jgi:hypothetical protein